MSQKLHNEGKKKLSSGLSHKIHSKSGEKRRFYLVFQVLRIYLQRNINPLLMK